MWREVGGGQLTLSLALQGVKRSSLGPMEEKGHGAASWARGKRQHNPAPNLFPRRGRGWSLALTRCMELWVSGFGKGEGLYINGHHSPTTKLPDPLGNLAS